MALVIVVLLGPALDDPRASARENPPLGPAGVDLGPLMVQPWGSPPANATFDGLWTSNRDCGVSTRLTNGRRLWVFCDSSLYDQNHIYRGNSASNTAAVASVADPLVIRDTLPGGRLVQFVEPSTFYPCDGYRATWPTSVATLPDDDGDPRTDRILVYYQNHCTQSDGNGGFTGVSYDVGVAEYRYDATTQPQAMKATVLNAQLFPPGGGQDYEWGGAVTRDAAGRSWLHLYSCLDEDGSCTVSRVEVSADAATDRSRVADPTGYQVWAGASGWVPRGQAAPVPVFTGGGAGRASASGLSIQYFPRWSRYVMAYTPWPAFQSQVAVRVAHRPEGPWSEPQLFDLPGCSASQHCYAANIQPHIGDVDTLSISYLKWGDLGAFRAGQLVKLGRLHVVNYRFVPTETATLRHNGTEHVVEICGGQLAFAYRWNGAMVGWFPIGANRWQGRPAAASLPDGSLEVYATALDGLVYAQRRQPDGAWSGPAAVGGGSGFATSGELVAGTTADGRVELFATDVDGIIHHTFQRSPGGADGWVSWRPLLTGTTFAATGSLAVAANADGRLELFAVGGGRVVWHVAATGTDPTTSWDGPAMRVLIPGQDVKLPRGLAAVTNADGRIEVFGVSGAGEVFHAWQRGPNGDGGWGRYGFTAVTKGTVSSGGISAVLRGDGAVEVVTAGPDWMTEAHAVQATPSLSPSMSGFSDLFP